MRANRSFREALRLIDRALTCPVCRKSRVRKAIAWRGRGTGQHGASHYAATAFEREDPATHCMCDTPGARAIAAIRAPEFCDASTLAVQTPGNPQCAHMWRESRTDDFAWWRCVKCPCEVGCDIPLPDL